MANPIKRKHILLFSVCWFCFVLLDFRLLIETSEHAKTDISLPICNIFTDVVDEKQRKMESEAESRGRFKVTVAPPPETSVGRFRLIPQGSPFLQRGRFSVIPEEETGSPLTQTKLSGPKIVVDHSPEWDFVSIADCRDILIPHYRITCHENWVILLSSFICAAAWNKQKPQEGCLS